MRKKLGKLSPKFYGPYKVIQRVGMVAYKLELLEGACIHPVFHVSFLKATLGEDYHSNLKANRPADLKENILITYPPSQTPINLNCENFKKYPTKKKKVSE
jgi:hypothetical protein